MNFLKKSHAQGVRENPETLIAQALTASALNAGLPIIHMSAMR